MEGIDRSTPGPNEYLVSHQTQRRLQRAVRTNDVRTPVVGPSPWSEWKISMMRTSDERSGAPIAPRRAGSTPSRGFVQIAPPARRAFDGPRARTRLATGLARSGYRPRPGRRG